MAGIFQKTFGGLTKAYLFRHYVFGAVLAFLVYLAQTQGTHEISTGQTVFNYIFTGVSFLLYPYAHFVYDLVMDFIMGDTVIFGNAIMMMVWKTLRMLFIFMFSLLIAPLGLAYLYFHHSRNTI